MNREEAFCVVTGLSEGSVLVDFTLTVMSGPATAASDLELMAQLGAAIHNGNVSHLGGASAPQHRDKYTAVFNVAA